MHLCCYWKFDSQHKEQLLQTGIAIATKMNTKINAKVISKKFISMIKNVKNDSKEKVT